jgi:hypothetical protein
MLINVELASGLLHDGLDPFGAYTLLLAKIDIYVLWCQI